MTPANRKAAQLIIAGVTVLVLFVATGETLRFAVADQLSLSNSIANRIRAADMFSGNADFLLRVVQLRERRGQDPRPELRRAVAVEPDNSLIWENLGLLSD